jgi:hypothetical protein
MDLFQSNKKIDHKLGSVQSMFAPRAGRFTREDNLNSKRLTEICMADARDIQEMRAGYRVPLDVVITEIFDALDWIGYADEPLPPEMEAPLSSPAPLVNTASSESDVICMDDM